MYEYKVTVLCTTFNQVAYIEKAVNSFLRQDTSFGVKILILNDCSTDKTLDVLNNLASQNLGKLQIITPAENLHQVSPIQPIAHLLSLVDTPYIAICDGDDFWLDERKLQRQVDFLEQNKDYSFVGHNMQVVDENDNIIRMSQTKKKGDISFTTYDLKRGNAYVPTSSLVGRTIKIEPEMYRMTGFDHFYVAVCGQHGKGMYWSDATLGGFRVQQNGTWSSLATLEKIFYRFNNEFWLYKYFSRCGEKDLKKYYSRKLSLLFAKAYMEKCYQRFISLRRIILRLF